MRSINEINLKLAVLGEGGVGKTSIVNLYSGKTFPNIYIPTIGSNITRKEYKLEDEHIRVNIWDIGGQKSFNPLNPSFFANIDAAFLVFDLSNPKESTIELQKVYLKYIKEKSPDCLVIYLGNKSDLVKPESFGSLLNNLNQNNLDEYPLIFTSAKTQDNVIEAFELMIFKFLKTLESEGFTSKFKDIIPSFLDLIDKREEELTRTLINIDSMDSSTIHKKITPKIRKKVVTEEIDDNKAFETPVLSVDNKLQLEKIKTDVIKAFYENFIFVKDLILSIKGTPIDQLLKKIEESSSDLEALKDDFELKLNIVLNLESKFPAPELENDSNGNKRGET
ncbi:MAG: GTP-binding protein [Candidatus Lokiarchaeota archaeon]|nr:GTP-binding protein [Candidatus Lokiarchaeota archaeon]